MQKEKKILSIIILLGILISTFYTYFNLQKYDRNQNVNQHLMIRGDLSLIWQESHQFKEDLKNSNEIFGLGKEYTRTFLPSKILSLFYLLLDKEFYENFEKKIVKIGDKFLFLSFQISLFYFALFFFYNQSVKYFKDKRLSLLIVAFLALDFNIIQWHSTFWTESIYFSLQIILLSILMIERKDSKIFFLTGLLLGILFLQKTVAIFLIFFLIIFFLFDEDKKIFFKNFVMILGFLTVIIFLLKDNYKKTGIIYFMPIQTKSAHYEYIAHKIINDKEGTIQSLKNKEEIWKKKNNYDENDFNSFYKYSNYKQQQAIKIMLENKIQTIKIYVRNSLSHFMLNPLQTYFWHEYNDKSKINQEFHLSDTSKKYFIFKVFYSLLFYSVVSLGVIRVFKNKIKIKFHLLVLSMVFYYMFMLGWVGNSRYFMPSVVLLSFFCGHGVVYLKKLLISK